MPPPARPADRGANEDGGAASSRPSFQRPGLQRDVAAATRAIQAAAQAAPPPSVQDATALGAAEPTVYRDRKGRKLEMLTEMMSGASGGDGGKSADQSKPSWGSGLVQQKAQAERRARGRADGAGPLARYEIDDETDKAKRDVMRFDDPMAQHLTMRAPTSNKPKYRGPAPPPNRFDIPPGYRWDGVDRSNGYEAGFFKAAAQARNEAQQARQWAQEDM